MESMTMLTITDKAALKAKEFMDNRGSGIGLRVAITTTGCSGYAYQLKFADRIEADDLEFYNNGIKIVVDEKSHNMINGTEIDYVINGLNEGFEFNNPLTKAKCGCGESFTV